MMDTNFGEDMKENELQRQINNLKVEVYDSNKIAKTNIAKFNNAMGALSSIAGAVGMTITKDSSLDDVVTAVQYYVNDKKEGNVE